MVLAVHPDDESLCAGGLIQQAVAFGGDVRVIFLTDGDNNPWPQRFVERRWRIDAADRARWGKRRRGEAVAALACLEVTQKNISFWHYPDQGLTELLLSGGEEIIGRLTAVISQWRPTLLVAPSMCDVHPDHSAAAVLLHLALDRMALARPRPFVLLDYLVHTRGEAPAGAGLDVELTPVQVARKRQAILSHTTQMALSRRRFLAFAADRESFVVADTPLPLDPSHPVRNAALIDGSLHLRLGPVKSPGTLLLAAETATGPIRQVIRFSPNAEPAIFDGISGKFQGSARLVDGQDRQELVLPAAGWASVCPLMVKVAFKRRFFDAMGWRAIPLAALSRPAEAIHPDGFEPGVCCVIPCYNLAGICGPIVRAAADFAEHVIAVNDGSTDETERVLREVAAQFEGRVQVLSFPVNRGKGTALLEAFRVAFDHVHFDVLVTLDGDGQHRPEDIPRVARAVSGGNCAFVVGERLARDKMPLRSRIGNTLTAIVMKLLYPGAPTDTQSGFRAFHRNFAREVVRTIRGGRYETELEILLLALRRGRRIGSVTIPTVYLDGNRLSHFRPIADSGRIYRTLFRWQFHVAGPRKPKFPLAANQ